MPMIGSVAPLPLPSGTAALIAAMASLPGSAERTERTKKESKLSRDLRRKRPDAVDRLYEEYGSSTFGFLVSLLGDRHTAEDVQQQVFLEAWQKAESFDPARGSLLNWLLMIARSRAIDHMRKRRPEPVDPSLDGHTTVDHRSDGEIDRLLEEWRVSHALARIPKEESHLLRMRFYEDLSQSEIANRTGIPLGTVKMRMVAGLGRLRSELETEGGLA